MNADARGLHRMAGIFEDNAAAAETQMLGVVTRGALNVKNDWRTNATATAGRHARHYPRTISYDVWRIPGGAMAEIGPDKAKKQGALGNILEFGTSRQAGHNDGGRALEAEEPRFAAQLEALMERLGRR
jgi:hypothetical protein